MAWELFHSLHTVHTSCSTLYVVSFILHCHGERYRVPEAAAEEEKLFFGAPLFPEGADA